VELSPESVRRNLEFPMQHIAISIEGALFRLAQGDDWDEVTSYECWLNSLARVNFSDHMRIIATTG
jgi:hypothetical protein